MDKVKKPSISFKSLTALFSMTVCFHTSVYAQEHNYLKGFKEGMGSLIKPKNDDSYKTVQLKDLSNFQFEPDTQIQELPTIGQPLKADGNIYAQNSVINVPSVNSYGNIRKLSIDEAVQIAIKRNPNIAQSIATLASQNASIDVAKAAYYPQLQAGLNTGNFTSSDKGRQVYTIEANQLLYDFGKVKSSVGTQQNKLAVEQANVLVSIDDIATQTSRAILATLRYQALVKIAQDQVTGVTRLYDIARLRANAGISSNADPVQAQSYVEYSKSYLIAQQNLLRQEQQKLKTLLGFDIESADFIIPDELLNKSGLYDIPAMNTIPSMIAANAEIEVAKSQRKQTELSRYPTVSLVGAVNKALNGVNPNTGRENDTDSSISISMSSNFYQGGAVGSQVKAAGFAEQAARSKLNAVYLDILDSTRIAREKIENTDKQIWILLDRERSTAKTRELYEEQYKLGKRSILDLLSSEQSYHSSRAERESARYDIYDTIAIYVNVTGRSREVYHLNNTNIQGFEILP